MINPRFDKPGARTVPPDVRAGENPGDRHIRLAMAHDAALAERALTRMARVVDG